MHTPDLGRDAGAARVRRARTPLSQPLPRGRAPRPRVEVPPFASSRWHALRRDPRRVGSWPALPGAALQAHRGTPGPLCSQEGALNLLLSLALARWIKMGERYPAGRPNTRSGARQEARQLSTRAALGAHSLLNVPARRRERCRWAPAALTASSCPRRRAVLAFASPCETLSPPACSDTRLPTRPHSATGEARSRRAPLGAGLAARGDQGVDRHLLLELSPRHRGSLLKHVIRARQRELQIALRTAHSAPAVARR